MQENNPQDTPRRRRRDKKSPIIPIIITLLFVLLAAGTGLYLFSNSREQIIRSDNEPLETETSQILKPEESSTDFPAEQHADSEEPDDRLSTEEIDMLAADQPAETPEEKKARECSIVAQQVHSFFSHVDSEDYIQQYELPEPSQKYFINLAYKLLKNPPVVSRESDDLYTILKNMAHFFRVIGKDNIILIKTILDRERDKIEDVAAELYNWTAWETCEVDQLQFSPALKDMYEYAGFFLNTMGGRSYLFRRDSRSRLLVNYYSVLLIERANQKGMNRHGIDITQIIPQLVQEIDASNQLIYKENYIDSLYDLLEKYE